MSLRDMVAISKEAEAAGFDSLYVTEAWRSGFVPLTAIAVATERVRLGTYVLNAYGRSPLLTGMSAIDLDELSRGRFLLRRWQRQSAH
jgi:alkanesulfonate monooxygenase SsuD/methylene tetrahydromethanopterin reductase-like flavin-dependent oxidoreductase (luciferase family)